MITAKLKGKKPFQRQKAVIDRMNAALQRQFPNQPDRWLIIEEEGPTIDTNAKPRASKKANTK